MNILKFIGLPVGLAALLALAPANAGVYAFSFSGSGFAGSGEFITTGATSPYTVIDVTGSASDESFGGGPSTITGVSGFLGADNLIPIDQYGISFSTADGNEYWLSGNGYMATFGSLYIADYPYPTPVGYSITPVPEPSTWALMALGFMGLGLAAQRARGARSIAA